MLQRNLGPTILTLRRSHTRCTLRRRRISLEFSSVRYSMVSQHMRSTTHAHFICSIVQGIAIVLFFRCMNALLNTADRARGNTKWGLVAHAVAMFSLVTIYTAFTLNIQSISYIDNRDFPGVGDLLPPGPVGYQFLIYSKPMGIVPNAMFILNNWLADGLLVRCIPTRLHCCLTRAVTAALPLLRYLWNELLGYRLPVPDVPRLFGCAFRFSAKRQ